ncbi:MAG TPA: glycosyltransferase family 2 protein, partial [Gemmatimonadaceae bacterium]|nr:glycosyltransferase family 2 protein [Gemmatimonadaceae bacterium]
FVDDGSGDRSLEMLLEHQRAHADRIKVVKLTRNFGSMAAIAAGLSIARGDAVGMIAADLQDPPELFAEMVARWEAGAKAIFAVRADREGSAVQKLFSNSYYALMRQFALPDYPAGGFDFFLVDRQVVNDINRIREKNTNLMSLIYWLGYEPSTIPYVRRARTKGKSRWTLSKKIKLFIDSFVAFSYVPIRFLSAFGILTALSAFAYAAWVFYNWAVKDIPVKGYAPTVILVALTAGVQMTMLGILGEYLWRTLDESRRRPAFVIDEVYAGENARSAQPDRAWGSEAAKPDVSV